MRYLRQWWSRLSLRGRLLLIGSGGLAAGFAVGGVVLVAALGFALQRNVDSDALSTARGVAAFVDADALSQPLPVGAGQFVQVIDSQRRVRAASVGADQLVPMLLPDQLAAVRAGQHRTVDGAQVGVNGPLRVVGVNAGPPDDRQTVIVARPLAGIRQSVGIVRVALLVTYPLIIIVLALFARRVVTAALRPVEALRAGAEQITGSAAGERPVADRLPVPDSHDEIYRLAVTLNDMLGRLSAARARQRAFVADAAHELRSPLTNMRTELEVAQRLGEPPDTDDLLADLVRLSRLVDDLLLLARADDAPGPAEILGAEPIDLAELLRETAGQYATARVPVVVTATGAGWAYGDRTALRHVLTNLVDNAARHAATRVDLVLVPGGFTVVDDGPGIPPAERERVFERFTRLDDARARDAGGSGLGLAIVRELVRRHGGTITLAPGDPGVRAQVRLPAYRTVDTMNDETVKGGSPLAP